MPVHFGLLFFGAKILVKKLIHDVKKFDLFGSEKQFSDSMSKNWDLSKSRCYNLTVTEICSNDSGRKQQKDKRTAHQTFYRISVALDQAFYAKWYYQSKFMLFQISGGAAVDEIDKSCKHLKECYKCAKQERS